MTRIIIALILVLIVSTFSHADWSKTTTTVSDEDTFIVSDNSEATGSKTKYIAVEDLASEVLDRANEPTVQADDPTVSSDNGIYFATTSQKMFIKDDGFLWASSGGTYTLIEEVVAPEYTLNLNISGQSGADAINGFTTSQVITGLTSDYTITGVLGDSTDLACTGTGVTGSGLSYLTGTASADVTADCVFSTVASTCLTQSASISNVPTSVSGSRDLNTPKGIGQSFLPTTTGDIYSIKVKLNLVVTDTGTLTIRVGDSMDLTTYETLETFALTGKVSGDEVEFVFSTKPTMTTGVEKFFMITTDADYNNRVQLSRSPSNLYLDGAEYYTTDVWAGATTDSYDLWFEVLTCD